MANVFISYRRQDNPYIAHQLRDRIEQRFGAASAFLDVDNMPLGIDFRAHLLAAVQRCDVMLVLIGDGWLSSDQAQPNNLFAERDYVRFEIEAALERDVPVVPVLVESAAMPLPQQLPTAIRNFVYLQAAEVRAGADFDLHTRRLVENVDALLTRRASSPGAEDPARQLTAQGDNDREDSGNPSVYKRGLGAMRETSHLRPELVKAAFGWEFSSAVYVRPSIPERRLKKALATFASDVVPQQVVALVDRTAWTGDRGLLFTERAMFWRDLKGNIGHADLDLLQEAVIELRRQDLKEHSDEARNPFDLLIKGNRVMECLHPNSAIALSVLFGVQIRFRPQELQELLGQ